MHLMLSFPSQTHLNSSEFYCVIGRVSSGSEVKNLPANAGDTGLIPGSERSPGGGNSKPLQYSCLKKFHGQRSLVGYSSRGLKETDTT